MNEKLSEEKINALKQSLLQTANQYGNKDYKKGDKASTIWASFSMGSQTGNQVYRSFSDEELLQYLRDEAKNLDHSPAQKEIFWVLREYIKARFKKWPYALKEAGLSSSAGAGGKTMEKVEEEKEQIDELLAKVREKAMELKKMPHPKDLPEVCDEIKKYIPDWGQVIQEANINLEELRHKAVYQIDDLEENYLIMLREIKQQAVEMNRPPLHDEVEDSAKKALIQRCGSWRNVLHQIGMEPVQRVRPFAGIYIDYRKEERRKNHTNTLCNSRYKLLNIDEQTAHDLNLLQAYNELHGRAPEKRDVPKELRQRLLEMCGSWPNALYQIGLHLDEGRTEIKGGKVSAKRRIRGKQ